MFRPGSGGFAEHNDPTRAKSKYTRKHGPWRLVWSEEHPTRSAAVQRERRIKSMKSARWVRDNLLDTQSESRRAEINRWILGRRFAEGEFES